MEGVEGGEEIGYSKKHGGLRRMVRQQFAKLRPPQKRSVGSIPTPSASFQKSDFGRLLPCPKTLILKIWRTTNPSFRAERAETLYQNLSHYFRCFWGTKEVLT